MKRRRFLTLSFGVPATGLLLAGGGKWFQNQGELVSEIPPVVGEVVFPVYFVNEYKPAKFGPIMIRTFQTNTRQAVEWHPFGDMRFDNLDDIIASGVDTITCLAVDTTPVLGGILPGKMVRCSTGSDVRLRSDDTLTIKFGHRGLWVLE